MKKNVNSIDKLVRVLAAIVLAVLLFAGTITGTVGIILGIVAVVLLVTSLAGFCPLYKVLGTGTVKEESKNT
jgi:predicted PurR-regulated permease PerM